MGIGGSGGEGVHATVLQPSFIQHALVFRKISLEGELHDLNSKIEKKNLKRSQCTFTRENALGKLKALSRDEQF